MGYLFAIPLPRWLGIPGVWGAAGLALAAGLVGWVEMLLLRHTLNARIGRTGLPVPYLATLWGAAVRRRRRRVGGQALDARVASRCRRGGDARRLTASSSSWRRSCFAFLKPQPFWNASTVFVRSESGKLRVRIQK